MQKTAVAVRHVHFEDLGTLAAVLDEAGYQVRYVDVGADDLAAVDPLAPDLLVVLGAPVGVYETDLYPFLAQERDLLGTRLAAGRATLGLCLGAQQIAATLGARVAPIGIKEIGFSELLVTETGRRGPLRHLESAPVLHWHGDGFAIPAGAERLASTPLCPNQAFAIGHATLGLQFHAEVDAGRGLERWLIGHAVELAGAGVDIGAIRREAQRVGPVLRKAARNMFGEWLSHLAQ